LPPTVEPTLQPTLQPTPEPQPLIKMPHSTFINIGETVSWSLHGFHNRTGRTVTEFAVVDIPREGLHFVSGELPAFYNGEGITYDIRYRVAGSSEWRTFASGIDASQPFSFSFTQPGDIYYTDIGLFFGTVPAYFGLGDVITYMFYVSHAPNNELINRFFVMHSDAMYDGDSPYVPTLVIPGGNNPAEPPTPNANANGNGQNSLFPDGDFWIEIGDDNVPLGSWRFDEEEWVFYVFDEEVPLAGMPLTKGSCRKNMYAILGSISFTIASIALFKIKRARKFANNLYS